LGAGVSFVPASMRSELVGRVATEPWWDGKLLGQGALATTTVLPAGSVAMSIALKPEQSVAGTIRSGDAVAVISSTAPGSSEPRTTILFASVPVLAVTRGDQSQGTAIIVTLRLRLEEARALAQARTRGPIDLVLVSGAKS
jgi:Flp pilus assembly protein CpaB